VLSNFLNEILSWSAFFFILFFITYLEQYPLNKEFYKNNKLEEGILKFFQKKNFTITNENKIL
jgi:hypothetical protein